MSVYKPPSPHRKYKKGNPSHEEGCIKLKEKNELMLPVHPRQKIFLTAFHFSRLTCLFIEYFIHLVTNNTTNNKNGNTNGNTLWLWLYHERTWEVIQKKNEREKKEHHRDTRRKSLREHNSVLYCCFNTWKNTITYPQYIRNNNKWEASPYTCDSSGFSSEYLWWISSPWSLEANTFELVGKRFVCYLKTF